MTRHDVFLELAAAGIDFRLPPADRARLASHLDACPSCRATASALHADARRLETLPEVMLPDRRAQAILAAVRSPAADHHLARTLAVAALLGLLLVGSLAVGARLLQRHDELGVIVPAPGPSQVVPETAAPSAPAATPSPTAVPLGLAWIPATIDLEDGESIDAVAAGQTGFVAVGKSCAIAGNGDATGCWAASWFSPDGRSWQRSERSDALDIGVSFPTSGPENGMHDVTAGPAGMVAIGFSARPAMAPAVWFSSDGIAWERVATTLPAASGGAAAHATDLRPLAVSATGLDGIAFVIVGEDRTGFASGGFAKGIAWAAAWSSADGRTWSRMAGARDADMNVGGFVDTLEDPTTGGMSDITGTPSAVVAVGSTCAVATCRPATWLLEGGSWRRTSEATPSEGALGAVAATSTTVVAVGRTGCGEAACPALVMTSPDGRTWTRRAAGPDGCLDEVTVIGGRFHATAPDGPTYLWTSEDGIAWVPATTDGGPATTRPPDQTYATPYHLAAREDLAVWIGLQGEPPSTGAWYSDAAASR